MTFPLLLFRFMFFMFNLLKKKEYPNYWFHVLAAIMSGVPFPCVSYLQKKYIDVNDFFCPQNLLVEFRRRSISISHKTLSSII